MPLSTTGELVAEAASSAGAVAAFNVITLEHIEAVIAAAEAAGEPVVLQLSENAVQFHGGRMHPTAAAAVSAAHRSDVPVALHLDHVKNEALLQDAADCGFSSVMFDAAHLPYQENVAATRKAVRWAHANGLWLEAELGEVGGKDGTGPLDAHAPGARTDPDEARRFVEETGVDALAVAIGSSHAMTSRDARIDNDLLHRLRLALEVPLVLHGSSGLSDQEIQRAVQGGINKVNIGTALSIAMTTAVRATLAADPSAVDPRGYLAAGRRAVTGTVTALLATVTTAASASLPVRSA
ncbi:class II fructose-bisphosphate aldolase family protein [Kitasatospora sp. NBC_00240]|uniref:class II fructose-bisphosphate aldolase n=1 Tax=Kitasatospora sp. NBC_00240 TaxID=2903567 RepID=UPI0022528F6B|nr:class II fructose-bisphosphate aldolase [Kitasatospora sp. NBC_00240]MCX5214508.1 class II fructose-bisphosphate aldolase family protein [Kitasatospora sp. NBC_00240]